MELAEAAEAEFMYRIMAAASPADQEVLGLVTRRLAGGVVLAAGREPSRYWNKALGFGSASPVNGDLIDDIIGAWRSAGAPSGVLQLPQAVLPDDWEEIRRSRGFEQADNWIKLAGRADTIGPAATELRVGPVGKEDAEEWARTLLTGFGFPLEGLLGMVTASTQQDGLHPYAAWAGDRIVATGVLTVHGEVGSMNAATTLPEFRGRGAQSALIAARAAGAREHGCRWVSAEVGELPPGRHSPTLENLRRAGLEPLYARPNFIWQAEPRA